MANREIMIMAHCKFDIAGVDDQRPERLAILIEDKTRTNSAQPDTSFTCY
jgi:hypothetical protein